ncbi:DEAD/DEAH box helicase family protein [Microvirga sp. BT688]|uniref:DEAD/DEAH box helicase n=1 Tax=Microvirga sp. TaxID=1873136 RepID=UPI0016874C74|nr:DEAD/DEAH box helicase family protein [Microvirga sp.]MBD2749852.1 DEAD/DEAH box helicase family protein [Microvirga sp.]
MRPLSKLADASGEVSALSLIRVLGDKQAEPYQARIMLSLREAIRRGRSGAVLAPTGSGKSLKAAAAAADAFDLGKPILILHPDSSLLRQNYAQLQAIPSLRKARVTFFVAKTEIIGNDPMLRNSLNADVIMATNMSLVNKLDDEDFLRGLDEVGRRGGIALIDEGHKAAAEQLSTILQRIARAGGSGIVLTATPFRTDGQDPLDPFGASIEHDLIDVATYDEVLATGRTVRTRFDIATGEFERHLGADAVRLIESAFLALLAENKSVDQASQQAFSRFFKEGASEGDKAIAALIVAAVARIWAKRASNATLAMVHCDSVEFSKELSGHLAQECLPPGHVREGEKPRVAFVVAGEIRVWRNGAEKRFKEGEPVGRKIKRDDLLDAARAGGFDILVNVNALGVGTDIPQTDLNILACQERSIGPVKQISGRGERAHKASGKTHQVFVDVGNSILRIFSDIDAMRRNDPERCRRQVRGLAAPIREQFEAWFDKDPSLREQIEERQRQIRLRMGEGDSEQYDKDAAPDLPRWLVATYDERTGAQQAFLCKTQDVARKYVAFVGIRHDGDYESANPTDKQRKFLRSLQEAPPLALPWLTDFTHPSSATHMSAAIDLLKDRAGLMGRLLNAAAVRLVERATGSHSLQPDLRSIVLDRPNQLTTQRRDLLAAYCRLRQRFADLFPYAFGGKPGAFSVTTFDPSVLPEIKAIVANTNIRFFVIDDAEKEEQLRPNLAEGLIKSSIVAVGPKGPSEQWIRQKAGFGRHDDATRAREQSFREYLKQLSDGPLTKDQSLTITLAKSEYLEIAAATPGKDLIRAMPSAVMNLLLLLGEEGGMSLPQEQVELIQDAIHKNRADIAVPFSLPRLCARYAQRQVPAQKKILKDLEKAANFKRNRDAYLLSQASTAPRDQRLRA